MHFTHHFFFAPPISPLKFITRTNYYPALAFRVISREPHHHHTCFYTVCGPKPWSFWEAFPPSKEMVFSENPSYTPFLSLPALIHQRSLHYFSTVCSHHKQERVFFSRTHPLNTKVQQFFFLSPSQRCISIFPACWAHHRTSHSPRRGFPPPPFGGSGSACSSYVAGLSVIGLWRDRWRWDWIFCLLFCLIFFSFCLHSSFYLILTSFVSVGFHQYFRFNFSSFVFLSQLVFTSPNCLYLLFLFLFFWLYLSKSSSIFYCSSLYNFYYIAFHFPPSAFRGQFASMSLHFSKYVFLLH